MSAAWKLESGSSQPDGQQKPVLSFIDPRVGPVSSLSIPTSCWQRIMGGIRWNGRWGEKGRRVGGEKWRVRKRAKTELESRETTSVLVRRRQLGSGKGCLPKFVLNPLCLGRDQRLLPPAHALHAAQWTKFAFKSFCHAQDWAVRISVTARMGRECCKSLVMSHNVWTMYGHTTIGCDY